ncbi:hypothetical protein QRZ34_27985 [Klebsiella michiganensis]|nr:hypothetical protein [Klebsiella michiganensis]MDL4454859.1 hypothetical protein [Klebsiella michiganensis]
MAKLQAAADEVAKNEGWAWAVGRSREVRRYSGDEKTFEILLLRRN